jgi:glucose/arabinose dehydrogenase
MQVLSRAVAIAAVLPAIAVAQSQPAAGTRTDFGNVHVERLATLEFPWGMAYLPDGRLLITEKPGRLRIFADGKLSPPVKNIPTVSFRAGESEQGGLLDVAVDPDFASTRHIYLSYSEETPQQKPQPETGDPRFAGYIDKTDNRLRGGVVARARLDTDSLGEVQVIWRQEPKTIGRGHFGHRIIAARDGTLFITSGDRMRFDPAQDQSSNLGKVVRINRDGSIPKDNPLIGKGNARGDIWTLGHRNVLSAAQHPTSGDLWVFEMGPLGGDELNILKPGRNYGWPAVSNGVNYDKSAIPNHSARKEFEAPARTWTPVISPSGALFYDGTRFPWKGHVIVGGLSSQALIRLVLEGEKIVSEERVEMKKRIRDVIQAPDGALLVITDDKNGELLRLTPANERR